MRLSLTVVALCAVLVTGCSEDDPASGPDDKSASATEVETSPSTDESTAGSTDESTGGTEGSSPTSSSPAPGTEIVASPSDFGTILFDATGQAIYIFDVETSSEPRCYDDCETAWPPVLTDGPPVAGAEVEASLLGTTERSDGTTQVTYNGHPLYFYAHEGKNEVLCHDVFLNGGNWYAVQPSGDRAP